MDYTARRSSRKIKVGGVEIGGDAKISVQSMTNTDTQDIEATYLQIKALAKAGCDVVRLAAPTLECAKTFYELKDRGIEIPLVADIHFDYKIALECVAMGADKIRINPGNIGDDERVRAVVKACQEKNIPIRIGVNSGSLEKEILKKYGSPTPKALAESALYHAKLLNKFDFYDICISVKASSVRDMIEANRIISEKTDYPLHLGVTEAGSLQSGMIKSAVGIGSLLSLGIGDTIRVSLTADPVYEVRAGKDILSSLGLNSEKEMDIISCPTCGRTKIDLIPLLSDFERALDREGLRKKPIKVAFMGCVVNGPGEAREADIGIAGGVGEAVLFKRGEIVGKVKSDEIINTLIEEIKRM
ncbi:MAG: flavodoxin-dependent (E)-4-hydroxy-3-methylbut-2-enyl-diphosphate synthase [Clostridia bacterium]|jgi:(E)-4-hydroxy-3-methylbut-2-enyl-diphosphate synthase|nr:flavodoxin-dependent (E)-4-hydroxy-3-methylbut-2-enyl-diphosphate synthase [Clostridia bacterium]